MRKKLTLILNEGNWRKIDRGKFLFVSLYLFVTGIGKFQQLLFQSWGEIYGVECVSGDFEEFNRQNCR